MILSEVSVYAIFFKCAPIQGPEIHNPEFGS